MNNQPSLPIGINNAKIITTALRLGLPVHKTANALNESQANGPTLFWTSARFHNVDTGIARQIVEKHTSVSGTNWRAALEELDLLIIPF